MWSTDGQAGFGGFGNKSTNESRAPGGFMSPGLNESQSENKAKSAGSKKNICPVTIGKIHMVPHTDDHVTINGEKMAMVTVCGLVLSVEEQSSKIVFELDDSTGPPIICQHWISTDSNTSAADIRSEVTENRFVRVTGALRISDGNRVILAFNVRKIHDFNEVTLHMIEVIHTSLSLSCVNRQDSANNASFGPPVNGGNTSMMEVDNPMVSANNGFTPNQNMVLKAVSLITSEDGASLDFLCQKLPSLTRSTIKQTLEFLNNEGHVYSTIDDDHYKATES